VLVFGNDEAPLTLQISITGIGFARIYRKSEQTDLFTDSVKRNLAAFRLSCNVETFLFNNTSNDLGIKKGPRDLVEFELQMDNDYGSLKFYMIFPREDVTIMPSEGVIAPFVETLPQEIFKIAQSSHEWTDNELREKAISYCDVTKALAIAPKHSSDIQIQSVGSVIRGLVDTDVNLNVLFPLDTSLLSVEYEEIEY
jgi:hypothetical protein